MRLYLIRHGQTDWNRDRKVMGVSSIPLNEKGRRSVGELARFLAHDAIPVIFSSTVARALESASILAGAWGAEVRDEPGFNESPYERWVGKTYGELAGDPEFDIYTTSPSRSRFSDSEGMVEIQERALAAVRRIVEGAGSSSDGSGREAGSSSGGYRRSAISSSGGYRRAAVVSHSDVIKPVIAHYLGMDLDSIHRLSIANASASVIDFGVAGRPRVRYLNVMPWKWRGGDGS